MKMQNPSPFNSILKSYETKASVFNVILSRAGYLRAITVCRLK
jgi:hypothetical protein